MLLAVHCTCRSRFIFRCYGDRRNLPSFPTRRSSDLLLDGLQPPARVRTQLLAAVQHHVGIGAMLVPTDPAASRDRQSTRLNSSHQITSYAVSCLKKKAPMESFFGTLKTELVHQREYP